MRIGIDIGTSVIKGVLFDSGGVARATRSTRHQPLQPEPGRFEYDGAKLVDEVLAILAGLPGDDVDLIALTGQGDGLWLLDDDGCPVRPAIAWLDNRGASACRQWSESGTLRTVFSKTANAPFPGAGAALLAALDSDEPDSLDGASTATQCQHMVFQRLTGVRTATRGCATLPVFNPSTGDYDEAALGLSGLDHRRGLLSDIAPGLACVAPMHEQLARRLGFAPGTKVATGPYDLPAAALGAGRLAAGDGILTIGTTLACQVRRDEVDASGEPVGLTLCAGDGDGWLRAMPAMVGTAGLDWVLRLISATHTDLGRLLETSPPGANGVGTLPYLSPAGERAPFFDPDASARFTGLSLRTTPADMVRALCESLAYAARHCFEAAGLTGDLVVCGGGTASEELTAVFADALDRPLRMLGGDQFAARGAVAAASLECGDADQGGFASASPRTVVEPRPAHREIYATGYAAYLDHVGAARRDGWRPAQPPPPAKEPELSMNDRGRHEPANHTGTPDSRPRADDARAGA